MNAEIFEQVRQQVNGEIERALRDGVTTNTTACASRPAFTMEVLAEVMKVAPPKPSWQYLVVRPDVERAMTRDFQFHLVGTQSEFGTLAGIQVTTKYNQRCPVWALTDLALYQSYLRDEIGEDFLELVTHSLEYFSETIKNT